MILAPLRNRDLEAVVRAAALPGEQVVVSPSSVLPAALLGFPRGAVVWDHHDSSVRVFRETGIPTLELARSGWVERMAGRSTEERVRSMRGLLSTFARRDTWIEGLFSDLERASGGGLPRAFRIFSRRPLEYPRQYQFTEQVAVCFDVTGGALKQRFARSGVSSPGSHLKWLRVFAASHVLRLPGVTTAQAAHRLGYNSSGNLCRSIQTLGGLSTTQMRAPEAWTGLLARFSNGFLGSQQMVGWESLEALFVEAA
jgi:AraC-like DNA-binding protein